MSLAIKVRCKLPIGFVQEISNLEETLTAPIKWTIANNKTLVYSVYSKTSLIKLGSKKSLNDDGSVTIASEPKPRYRMTNLG